MNLLLAVIQELREAAKCGKAQSINEHKCKMSS